MSTQTDYVSYLNSVSNEIIYYGLWIILPSCVVGNLISLYIYSRPSLNKKTHTGFLYRWLCFLNLVTVIYYSLVYRGNALFNYTVNWPCGVDDYIRRIFLNSITWIQVVICFDRFVGVVYPTKRNLMAKKRALIGIMLICFAIILIANMTNLMTYPVMSTNNTVSCYTANNVFVVTNLIATLMRVFIPFGLMLTLNLLVIYYLKRSRNRASIGNVIQYASQSRNPSLGQLTYREFRFIVSTLIIDFVFLFFYLPLGIAYAIVIYNLFGVYITSDPIGYAIFNLFSNLSQLFALSHTSALIFIFIIFNRSFRTELILLLRLHILFPLLVSENNTNINTNNQ